MVLAFVFTKYYFIAQTTSADERDDRTNKAGRQKRANQMKMVVLFFLRCDNFTTFPPSIDVIPKGLEFLRTLSGRNDLRSMVRTGVTVWMRIDPVRSF